MSNVKKNFTWIMFKSSNGKTEKTRFKEKGEVKMKI